MLSHAWRSLSYSKRYFAVRVQRNDREPIGPDGLPFMPLEEYMADPYNLVRGAPHTCPSPIAALSLRDFPLPQPRQTSLR